MRFVPNIKFFNFSEISADRTNSRVYATVLRPSVVVVCTECIVAKRCILVQKLLLTAYRKSLRNRLGGGPTNMNDLDLCLAVG